VRFDCPYARGYEIPDLQSARRLELSLLPSALMCRELTTDAQIDGVAYEQYGFQIGSEAQPLTARIAMQRMALGDEDGGCEFRGMELRNCLNTSAHPFQVSRETWPMPLEGSPALLPIASAY